jgi:hypothetical protein
MHAALVRLTINADEAPAAAVLILPTVRSAPGFVAGYRLAAGLLKLRRQVRLEASLMIGNLAEDRAALCGYRLFRNWTRSFLSCVLSPSPKQPL